MIVQLKNVQAALKTVNKLPASLLVLSAKGECADIVRPFCAFSARKWHLLRSNHHHELLTISSCSIPSLEPTNRQLTHNVKLHMSDNSLTLGRVHNFSSHNLLQQILLKQRSSDDQFLHQLSSLPAINLLLQRCYAVDTKKTFSETGSSTLNSSTEEDNSAKKDLQLKRGVILTVPNVLTFFRILLTPALGYLVLTGAYTTACGVFIVASVTDVLDGFIARKFSSQMSALGSFLDPFADKLLVSTLFVTLTIVNLIPVALAGLVIFRDICLMSGGFYVRYISLSPRPKSLKQYFDVTNVSACLQPTKISKLNTGVQLALVAFTLGSPVFNYVDHPAMHALWYLTASTTLVSGIGYIFAKDTFKIIRNSRLKKP